MSVWIVRHGERIDKVDKSWMDNNVNKCHDPPLTDKGKWQAKLSGRNIRRREPNEIKYIYTSPFTRCVETSLSMLKEIRKKYPKCLIRIELGITECVGDWMSWSKKLPKDIYPITNEMTLKYFDKVYPNCFDTKYKSYWKSIPHRECSQEQTIYRFYKTVKHILHQNTPIILCTHSFSVGQISLLFDKTIFKNLVKDTSNKTKIYEKLAHFSEVIHKSKKDKELTEEDFQHYKNNMKDSNKNYCCIIHMIKENKSWKIVSGPSISHWENRIKVSPSQPKKPSSNFYYSLMLASFSLSSLYNIFAK